MAEVTIADLDPADAPGDDDIFEVEQEGVSLKMTFAQLKTAIRVGLLTNITDLIEEGSNVTITGDGTAESPYVISAAGGGGGGGLPEAPVDGKLYGRKDGAWAEVPAGGFVIDDLDPATSLADADEIPVSQDGGAEQNKVSLADLRDFIIGTTGKGYSGINEQTGTSYTLALTDAGLLVTMNNASPNTITVPAETDVAFPTGIRVDIGQDGTGQTTVVADTGVTIRTPETLNLRKQWSKASLIYRGSDTWDLIGDLEEDDS